MAIATLGGGCFWCLEAIFQDIKGVHQVISGYAGGILPNPDYEMVCTGLTGHAEVVQIEFDEQVIDYEQVLNIFFASHDPTTLNRQGNDVGSQYRSCIFYANEQEYTIARQKIDQLNQQGIFDAPVVTTLEALKDPSDFYPAESYHQNYYRTHPNEGYCAWVITPKLARFRQKMAHWLR